MFESIHREKHVMSRSNRESYGLMEISHHVALQGCEQALKVMKEHFPDMQILSLSGNFCTDKKSSAVNW